MNNSSIKNWISNLRFAGRTPQKGMVFIPDISGFTELVRRTDLAAGKTITYELLNTLIRTDTLAMEIAEIEGDAIFFVKRKSIPSPEAMFLQFEAMKSAFDAKVRMLQARYGFELNLTLKAVAHYGEISEFRIKGFRKFYGEVVVEAHRLLKNHVPGRSYLLITDELMAFKKEAAGSDTFYANPANKLCELYEGLRNLCFTYVLFDYWEPALPHFKSLGMAVNTPAS